MRSIAIHLFLLTCALGYTLTAYPVSNDPIDYDYLIFAEVLYSKPTEIYHGNIHTVKETSYWAEAVSGQTVKGDIMSNFTHRNNKKVYDREGCLVEYMEYEPTNNALDRKVTYEYDDNGLLLESRLYKELYKGDNDDIYESFEFRYNDNGFAKSMTRHDAGKLIGRLEMKQSISENGNFRYECSSYDEKGQFRKSFSLEFNRNGQIIEDGFDNYTYRYDSVGRLISVKRHNYPYFKYEYDDNGLLLSREDGPEEKCTYKYEKLDGKGNWIRRVEYDRNGNPVIVTEREIEYY